MLVLLIGFTSVLYTAGLGIFHTLNMVCKGLLNIFPTNCFAPKFNNTAVLFPETVKNTVNLSFDYFFFRNIPVHLKHEKSVYLDMNYMEKC